MKVEPEFGMIEQIIINDVQDVFGIDALESSHPISVEVNDPNEINELFDDISYGKGSSFLPSLQTILFLHIVNYFIPRRFNYPDAKQISGRAIIPRWTD